MTGVRAKTVDCRSGRLSAGSLLAIERPLNVANYHHYTVTRVIVSYVGWPTLMTPECVDAVD